MIRSEVAIINKLGLHARAAAKFVTLASRFKSEVLLQRGSQEVNGKNIMEVMMLAASQGTCLGITISGPDEEEALRQLEELINQRFGERE